jgi:glucokinase
VAQDAQFKFMRFGIASNAYTDARLQVLAAGVLKPGDAVVIISSTGRIAELLDVADIARERGATVVAITASQSPLAKKADIALIVDHPEDVNTQLPMVSRVLHLLVIDILAVGVSMRRQGGAEAAHAEAEGRPAATRPRPTPPGVSASLPYARLTSHGRR